jgi:cellulose biosynthesis protein BcsQ
MPEGPSGRVITFYSYKGGTGRSMALANVAFALAQRNGGKRILAVDWDLEAPGLHRYFRPYIKIADIEDRPGLIEILSSLREALTSEGQELERGKLAPIVANADWDTHTLATDLPSLDFIKAGRFDASYSERINTFGWEDLYRQQPNFFGAIGDHLAQRYAYVLVDSRTGLTDISGICTALLPDTIVAVFTPNRQSIDGAIQILRQAVDYRRRSDDLRALRVFPLASRIEVNEKKLQEAWRFGDREGGLKGYQAEFENLFKELYGLDVCDLKAYFNDAQIQYVPFYSFGEEIAVRSEVESNLSLARSYTNFEEILSAPQNPWDYTSTREVPTVPAEEIPWDEEWFEEQKRSALEGLHKAGRRAYMEVRFSLVYVRTSNALSELLEAARGAQVPYSGWPFGLVLTKDELRPRPAADGIVAEISTPYHAYDYWFLRMYGDFFLLRSLPEDDNGSDAVFFDMRITQVAEALLYCKRLYERLGLSPRAAVRITIEHSGIRGRTLSAAEPSRRNFLQPRPSEVDSIKRVVKTSVGGIESDIVDLKKQITAPMFELFDFYKFEDSVYEQLIRVVSSGRSGR